MYVKVVMLRYQEGVQGFPEGALREATAGCAGSDSRAFSRTGNRGQPEKVQRRGRTA
jgi:hypothetical protein